MENDGGEEGGEAEWKRRSGVRDVVLDGPGLRAANGPACFPRAGPCRPACWVGGPYPARLAGPCQPRHDAGRAKKTGLSDGPSGCMDNYSVWRVVWTRRGHHRARRAVRTRVLRAVRVACMCVHIWCAFKRSVLGVWFWGLLSDGFAPERDRSTSARAAALQEMCWRGVASLALAAWLIDHSNLLPPMPWLYRMINQKLLTYEGV